MDSERGQATVEWTWLVVLVSAVFGGLLTLAPAVDGRSVGGAVAHAISCAARGGCGADRRAPRAVERAPPRPGRRAVGSARTAAAFQALRGVRYVAKRVWLVCLGYRRYRYELEHPHAPNEAMPLTEAVDIANECLNPFGFLTED